MDELGDLDDLRRQLTAYLRDLIRHLVKQDTLENAGFFEDQPARGGWNNDTVVAAMQWMIAGWLHEHWQMDLEQRQIVDRGLVPPNKHILEALGFLTEVAAQREERPGDFAAERLEAQNALREAEEWAVTGDPAAIRDAAQLRGLLGAERGDG